LTLRWNTRPESDAQIEIMLISDTKNQVADFDSLFLNISDVRDRGSYTIDRQTLAGLVSGPISIEIRRTAFRGEWMEDELRWLYLSSKSSLQIPMVLED
jgi:hypothetical protein